MDLLLRNVLIADPSSPWNGKQTNLHIRDLLIEQIGDDLPETGTVIDLDGALVSPGWIDVGAWVPDPGMEQRETLGSAAYAAAAGGFTGVAIWPNADPVVDGKAEVQYIRRAETGTPVQFLPIGAISEDARGKEITEMLDMRQAGAVAFSDGIHSVQHSGLLLRALIYVKGFDGTVINRPMDMSLAVNGQMHEGNVSTSLGLPGIPDMAETLMVQRDIDLLAYADSRLHLAHLSSARSVNLVREAKAAGLKVTCSVPALQLLYTDEDLFDFDANLKVLPPFRSAADREALIEGLLDGTIDLISSNHVPLEEEAKKLEFPFAQFGAIGLQSAFRTMLEALDESPEPGWIAELMAHRPRKVLGLDPMSIAPNKPANLTVFRLEGAEEWLAAHSHSRSRNSPLWNRKLPGSVVGVINGGLQFGLY